MMKKLQLPIIKGSLPEPKWLSMREYINFVTFNLKYTSDRKAGEKWRRRQAVNVPFSIK